VITSVGSNNQVDLFDNSSATIHDQPTGSGLFLELNGITPADTYTGKVTVTGFQNDLLNGRIDFDNVKGANGALLDGNLLNVIHNTTSDGHGGDVIHLAGGGSLDLTNSLGYTTHTFV